MSREKVIPLALIGAAILAAGQISAVQVVRQVSADADDADAYGPGPGEQRSGEPTAVFAYDQSHPPPFWRTGLVFPDVAIPREARIDSARLEVQSWWDYDFTVHALIEGEASDWAFSFDYLPLIGQRPLTTASVAWTISVPWAMDSIHSSPDISSVVQEIVDRRGWFSRSRMALYLSAAGQSGSHRQIHTFESVSGQAAKLIVAFSVFPDLAVERMYVSPSSTVLGTPLTANVTVANTGSGDAGAFQVDFYRHGASPPGPGAPGDHTWTVPSLAVGHNLTLACSFTPSTEGFYEARVQVDRVDAVSEADETNNGSEAFPYRVGALGPVTRRAVLCGVAAYPDPYNTLSWADDDAVDLAHVLAVIPEWAEAEVALLTNSAATKAAIKTAIDAMRQDADANDVCLFFFSGHGSWGYDTVPLDEVDDVDEYLIPAGAAASPPDWIRDDELAAWLDAFPAPLVVLIDAGWRLEGGNGTIKTIPGEGGAPWVDSGFGSDLSLLPGGAVLVVSCEEAETSREYDAGQNGLFSEFVLEALSQGAYEADAGGDGRISAEEIFAYAASRTSARNPLQHPRIYDNYPLGSPHAGDLSAFRAPTCTLRISSPHGLPDPPAGLHTNVCGTPVAGNVSSPDLHGSTQYVCTGWSLAGITDTNGLSGGQGSGTTMLATNNAVLTWFWKTNFWFGVTGGPNGTTQGGNDWQEPFSLALANAIPGDYYGLLSWTGTITSTDNSLQVTMDQAHSVVAVFAENLATNETPEWWLAIHGWTNDFDAAAMGDEDSDGMPAWIEFHADTIPTDGDSVLAITGLSWAVNGVHVTWKGGTNAWQCLETRQDLVGTGEYWSTIFTNVPPTSGTTDYLHEGVTNRTGAYRLKAWR